MSAIDITPYPDAYIRINPELERMIREIHEAILHRVAANPDINKRLLKLELAVSTLMPDKSQDI